MPVGGSSRRGKSAPHPLVVPALPVDSPDRFRFRTFITSCRASMVSVRTTREVCREGVPVGGPKAHHIHWSFQLFQWTRQIDSDSVPSLLPVRLHWCLSAQPEKYAGRGFQSLSRRAKSAPHPLVVPARPVDSPDRFRFRTFNISCTASMVSVRTTREVCL
jgi:hypothetical protein